MIVLAVPACTAGDLRPLPSMLQGATGSMLGPVWLRNVSVRRCAIGGRPKARLLADGRVLATRQRAFEPEDDARSVKTLAVGRRARLYVQWSNWCGAWPPGRLVRTLRLELTLTNGTHVSARVRTGRARCDAPTQPSRLYVSSFGIRP